MQLNAIINILIIIWLLLCSLQDIRKKKIHIFLIAAGFLVIFTYSLLKADIMLWNRLAGVIPGSVLLILNPITRGQIGLGDGLIVSILGLCLGFSVTAGVLALGLFISAILSLSLIIFKKVNKKTAIPFIPFLLLGFMGVLII